MYNLGEFHDEETPEHPKLCTPWGGWHRDAVPGAGWFQSFRSSKWSLKPDSPEHNEA